jgi:hypothetical protein
LATVQLHLVGHATFAFLPAVALALGAWLDRRAEASVEAQPLLAFVTMVSALLLARDLTLVPEALVSSHLATRIPWPAGVNLAPWVLGTGESAPWDWDCCWGHRRDGRRGRAPRRWRWC